MLGDPRAWHAPASPVLPQHLPFRIRLARNEPDLYKAAEVRRRAYGRHLPAIAHKLAVPEDADRLPGVTVLLAESKVDGSPLGTARLQTNRHQALALEQNLELPPWLSGKVLAHVNRLAVVPDGMGRLIKLMLFKGLFLYWEHHGIDWAVVAARSPLDRMYEQLLFADVFPDRGPIPLPHMGDLPHRIMAFEVSSARQRWAASQHPLLNFMVHTRHPDLDIASDQAQRPPHAQAAPHQQPRPGPTASY
jgi:hypothetical protein